MRSSFSRNLGRHVSRISSQASVFRKDFDYVGLIILILFLGVIAAVFAFAMAAVMLH
jgi:hypothetical protein